MKNIYFLLMLLGAPFIAVSSEIPAIYSCIGGYIMPVTQISSIDFCQVVHNEPAEIKKIEIIEAGAMKYDLSRVKCNDDVDLLVSGVLFRYAAESSDNKIFLKLSDRKKDVNYIADSQMRNITPAGVAAICGYKENLNELIQLGGVPKANLKISLSTSNGVVTRTFSLKDAMDFDDPLHSNYENMELSDQNILFEDIYRLIETFK